MRIVGIDLASEPKNTGVVVLDVDAFGQAVALLVMSAGNDDDLVALAREVDVVAIDAPLGWPTRFVAALAAHHAGSGWPFGADRRALRHRRTDLAVQDATGLWPLSVSSDKLGVTAMRCAHLQHRWAEEVWGGLAAARDGSGPLIEVYPAATLKTMGLPHRSYKGADGLPERSKIIAGLAARVDLTQVADRARASDHVLDALVAALTARAVAEGRTIWPAPGEETALALVEGWIHVPRPGDPPDSQRQGAD